MSSDPMGGANMSQSY